MTTNLVELNDYGLSKCVSFLDFETSVSNSFFLVAFKA